jgi:peptidoglycan/LPS O-acetylase OafA/YrhL
MSENPGRHPMKYRREVDGLRALAVVPVILYHAGFRAFSGGFVGVDVFFVISGYLITSIIRADLEAGRFSIAAFYERRARRILPALFVVVLSCIPCALWLMPASDLDAFAKSVAAVATFSSNMLFARSSGYFDMSAELKPLLHTWSLAVEEQYYVLFPLFLWLIWPLGTRALRRLFGLIFVASLAAAQWGTTVNPAAAFYWLPTRGWELLLGAFLALHLADHAPPRQPLARWRELAGAAGIALILFAVFRFDQQTPFPGLYALLPTVGATLIILCATEHTRIGRLLGSKPIVAVGLISYSAYLWHQPLFVFARYWSDFELTSRPLLLALSAASLVLAYGSWKYVEVPFRNRQKVLRPLIVRVAVSGTVLLASLGLAGHAFYKDKADIDWTAWSAAVRQDRCMLQVPGSVRHESECIAPRKAVNVLLWGDSHAAALYPGLSRLADRHGWGLSQLTQSGCPPLDRVKPLLFRPNCNRLNDDIVRGLPGRFDVIILHAAWMHDDYPMGYAELGARLDAMLRRIRSAAPSATVVILSNVPRWYISAERAYMRVLSEDRVAGDAGRPDGSAGAYAMASTLPEIDRVISHVASRHGAVFISAVRHLCVAADAGADHRPCLIATDRRSHELAYVDWGHFTLAGSTYFAAAIEAELVQAVPQR